MQIFDFHMHPGYDFHDNETDSKCIVEILKSSGICGCAGSYINRAMNRRPAEEFAWRMPELNEQAWVAAEKTGGFLIPGIHIHPDFPELSCKEMDKHKARGGVLLGELVYYMMGYQYTHPCMGELLHYARDLGFVASMHPALDMAKNVAFVESAGGMDVVIAHLGIREGVLHEQILQLMQNNDHVYVDLAAYGGAKPGKLRDAVNRVGSERILYGTDFPGVDEQRHQQKYIDYVLSENLSMQDVENILYKNAARLLRLEHS